MGILGHYRNDKQLMNGWVKFINLIPILNDDRGRFGTKKKKFKYLGEGGRGGEGWIDQLHDQLFETVLFKTI